MKEFFTKTKMCNYLYMLSLSSVFGSIVLTLATASLKAICNYQPTLYSILCVFFTDFRLQESFFNLPQLLFPENVMQDKDNTLGMVYVRNSIQNTMKIIYLEFFCSLKNWISSSMRSVYRLYIFFLYFLILNGSGPENWLLISANCTKIYDTHICSYKRGSF